VSAVLKMRLEIPIRWGILPNITWVYAWLFYTDEPVDAEILSEELDMSRGAGGTPYSRISVSGFRS